MQRIEIGSYLRAPIKPLLCKQSLKPRSDVYMQFYVTISIWSWLIGKRTSKWVGIKKIKFLFWLRNQDFNQLHTLHIERALASGRFLGQLNADLWTKKLFINGRKADIATRSGQALLFFFPSTNIYRSLTGLLLLSRKFLMPAKQPDISSRWFSIEREWNKQNLRMHISVCIYLLWHITFRFFFCR